MMLGMRDLLILNDAQKGDVASMRYIIAKLFKQLSAEDTANELYFSYNISIKNIKRFFEAYEAPEASDELINLTNKVVH